MTLFVPKFSLEETLAGQKSQQRRLDLLECIHRREGDDASFASAKSLNKLKEEYNFIVEDQISSQKGPFSDPLQCFPPELFVLLVQEVISRRSGTSVKDLLMLSLLNSYWREAVVSEPSFWRDVCIGPGLDESDIEDRLRVGLYLSGNQPLNLSIDHPVRDWSYLLEILRPHLKRVQNLVIWPPSSTKLDEEADVGDPTVGQVLLSLGPLPNLKRLELESRYHVEFDAFLQFLDHTPVIRSISGDHISPRMLEHEHLAQLEKVQTCASIKQLPYTLSRFPRLTSLIVDDPAGDWSTDEDESYYKPTKTVATEAEKLSLSSLMTLEYRQSEYISLPVLIQISPQLYHLDLRLQWQLLATLMPLLEQLGNLEYLGLVMTRTKGPEDIFDLDGTRSFPTLKTFTFYQSEEDHSDNLAQLFTLLVGSNLRKVTISVDKAEIIPLAFLATLEDLRHLSLKLPLATNLGGLERIQARVLEYLELSIPLSIISPLVSSMECPKLVSLELRSPTNDWEPQSSLYTFPPNALPSLFSIEWGLTGLRWDVTKFTSLKIIQFREEDLNQVSEFCVNMILHPKDCPALEQLQFAQYPEWDLLFIMLERRNFLPDTSISAIKLVSMPSSMNFRNRRFLTDVLRGRFAHRMSNEELSLPAIGRLYFDSDVPGCHHCCMSLQFCKEELLNTARNRHPIMKANALSDFRSADPPLSPQVRDWLSGRAARYTLWNQMVIAGRHQARAPLCVRHELGWRYITTGFTFADVPRITESWEMTEEDGSVKKDVIECKPDIDII